MNAFASYLEKIDHPDHRERIEEILTWVAQKFPNLEPVIKWNQPMFIDHGTYIIGFSISKKHASVAPEKAGILQFANEIKQSGFDHTAEIIRMPWNKPVNYALLEKMIEFNVTDKADCTSFWR